MQIGVKKVSECDKTMNTQGIFLSLLMTTAAGPSMKLALAIVLVVSGWGGAPIFLISEPR